MAHLVLLQVGRGFPRSGTEVPVGGEQEQQVVSFAMALTQFEDGLTTGDVVSAVSVDEDQSLETVLNEVFGKTVEQIEIGARRGGQGAGEIEVVVRVAQPGQWCKQNLVTKRFLDPSENLTQQQAVGEERQVVPVLFQVRFRMTLLVAPVQPGVCTVCHSTSPGALRLASVPPSLS